jgi:peptidoglycan/LPS O-acetylase OafA/YrhL
VSLHFRSDIEGLRAVAILLVVAYHAHVPYFQGGFVGVDVFFVLSGYLITGLLLKEIAETGKVDLMRFYARRVKRLLPAVALMLFVTVVAAYIIYSPLEQIGLPNSAFATAGYASNLYFARIATDYLRAATTDINPFLHTWSLSVEEQFYLLWPMLILFAVRPKRTTLILGVVAVVSLTLCIWLTYYKQPWAFFLSPTRAWEFAVGGLGFILIKKKNQVIGWCGLGLIILAAVTFGKQTAFPGAAALLPAIGTVAVLSAGEVSSVGSVLSARVLQWIGRVSYSWYLWHWPVLVFANAKTLGMRLVCVAFSLVLAIVSYRLVENPVRRSKRLAPSYTLAMAACLTIFGMVTALTWRQLRTRAAASPTQARFTKAGEDRPAVYSLDCFSGFFEGVKQCTFGDRESSITIVLFGDSHAAQWFPALDQIAQDEHWRLVTFLKSACAPEDVSYVYPTIGRRYTECEQWRSSVLEKIKELRPALVVMTGSQWYVTSISSGTSLVSEADYLAGAKRTLNKLEESGTRVLFLRDSPAPGFAVPACLARAEWQIGWRQPSGCSFDRQGSLGETIYKLEMQASQEFQRTKYFDLTDYLCVDRVCPPEKDGVIIYRDSDHLSVPFVTAFAPTLKNILRSEDLFPR